MSTSLLQRLRRWLYPASAPEDGASVLGRLGVDAVFLSWAQAQGTSSLAELWHACPRADWLIDLATRAGLRRPLIGEALESCFEALERSGTTRRSAELELARRTSRDWLTAGGLAQDLCLALGEAVNLACDADAEVMAARLAGREAIGREYPEARLHAHLAELNALQRVAEAVRSRLRYDELHTSVFERPSRATPYR